MKAVVALAILMLAACRSGTGPTGVVVTVLMHNTSSYAISGAMETFPSGLLLGGNAAPHSGDTCFRWTAQPGDSVRISMFSTAPVYAPYSGVVQRAWVFDDSHLVFYATDTIIGMQGGSPC